MNQRIIAIQWKHSYNLHRDNSPGDSIELPECRQRFYFHKRIEENRRPPSQSLSHLSEIVSLFYIAPLNIMSSYQSDKCTQLPETPTCNKSLPALRLLSVHRHQPLSPHVSPFSRIFRASDQSVDKTPRTGTWEHLKFPSTPFSCYPPLRRIYCDFSI